jgi:hypothetical protein
MEFSRAEIFDKPSFLLTIKLSTIFNIWALLFFITGPTSSSWISFSFVLTEFLRKKSVIEFYIMVVELRLQIRLIVSYYVFLS